MLADALQLATVALPAPTDLVFNVNDAAYPVTTPKTTTPPTAGRRNRLTLTEASSTRHRVSSAKAGAVTNEVAAPK